MKKVANLTPNISVTKFESDSGPLYDLYINGRWYLGYSSLSAVTKDIQAIIQGTFKYDEFTPYVPAKIEGKYHDV